MSLEPTGKTKEDDADELLDMLPTDPVGFVDVCTWNRTYRYRVAE